MSLSILPVEKVYIFRKFPDRINRIYRIFGMPFLLFLIL